LFNFDALVDPDPALALPLDPEEAFEP